MKSNRQYSLEGNYKHLLETCGITVEVALRRAGLPEDIFSRSAPTLTAEAYFSFMEAVEAQLVSPGQIVQIGSAEHITSFSPSIFAAYCSREGVTCLKRLSRYKRLVGPVHFLLHDRETKISLESMPAEDGLVLPPFLAAAEAVFIVHLLRNATGVRIVPLEAEFHALRDDWQGELSSFLGCRASIGQRNMLTFSIRDLQLPFTTRNDSMWEFFEPELSRRLSELDLDASTSARLRSALIELLPGGDPSIEGAAGKLSLGKRTLQRQLAEEGTTFQKQLNHTRELLARHYLKDFRLSSDEIAYLLGYQEQNSFLRAFALWTGMSISEYRKSHRKK